MSALARDVTNLCAAGGLGSGVQTALNCQGQLYSATLRVFG